DLNSAGRVTLQPPIGVIASSQRGIPLGDNHSVEIRVIGSEAVAAAKILRPIAPNPITHREPFGKNNGIGRAVPESSWNFSVSPILYGKDKFIGGVTGAAHAILSPVGHAFRRKRGVRRSKVSWYHSQGIPGAAGGYVGVLVQARLLNERQHVV